MPVPTDPIVLVLTAIVLWSFWIACVLRDRKAAAVDGLTSELLAEIDRTAAAGRKPSGSQS